MDRDEHFDGEKGEAKVDPNLVAIKVSFTEKAMAEFKSLRKSLKESWCHLIGCNNSSG